ncbi:uroporphyrinogen decarboxylase [Niveomyces insectorum RCEF 264]|uniref:uroporphyrinogen decarboxylase n=1 Tax=Niveomyces insectorum RCEF 264 TaxID=1081102 RepID=A0A167U4G1_9HYPO|nr:uroporphyrinogen decarboxylase [Niveomyces insectorum RCEF 264]
MGEQKFEPLQNDLIIRAALGQKVERPPAWVMRQAGRYLPEYHEAKGDRDFFACCRDPEIASTLTLQPIERFAGLLDAAIIFSDILVIPQALGMTVEMVDKKGPHFPQPLTDTDPERDPQYARVLATDTAAAVASLDYVYRAVTLARTRLRGRVPLIGFCGAPWTLLCYMVEVDSWAGELSPRAFAEFAAPSLAYIAAHLPRRLAELGCARVPMILFPKGAWYALDACCDRATMGYDVVGLDWQHDPAAAVRTRGDRPVVLQGNADPGVLYGTHASITAAVQTMVEGFGWAERRQGWIVNLGHGITPFVKPESLKFFLEEVQRQTKI